MAILLIRSHRLKAMPPRSHRRILPGPWAIRRVEVMEERCKHDLLPGHCGFCQVPSSEPAEQVNGRELVEWLGRFARAPERSLPKKLTAVQEPPVACQAQEKRNVDFATVEVAKS